MRKKGMLQWYYAKKKWADLKVLTKQKLNPIKHKSSMYNYVSNYLWTIEHLNGTSYD